MSIVTPSFNMAPYLRETIESILSQDYPNIEYVIMDGGSTDGTLEILARYAHRIRYISAPDRGAADAINRGFELTKGSIFNWLSADDTLLPGAVSAVVRRFASSPDLAGVYGQGYWVDEQGGIIDQYPAAQVFSPEVLQRECCVCQPACFVRRSAFERVGGLDASLQVAFDYDLWIRMAHLQFSALPDFLATSRMHRDNKTLGQRKGMFRECFEVLRKYYGYVPFQWVFGYCCYQLDHRDQFYEPLRPSLFKYTLSLPVGCWYNWKHMGRYSAEWFSKLGPRQFALYWQQAWIARALGLARRRA